jgi:hypothetical protein
MRLLLFVAPSVEKTFEKKSERLTKIGIADKLPSIGLKINIKPCIQNRQVSE